MTSFQCQNWLINYFPAFWCSLLPPWRHPIPQHKPTCLHIQPLDLCRMTPLSQPAEPNQMQVTNWSPLPWPQHPHPVSEDVSEPELCSSSTIPFNLTSPASQPAQHFQGGESSRLTWPMSCQFVINVILSLRRLASDLPRCNCSQQFHFLPKSSMVSKVKVCSCWLSTKVSFFVEGFGAWINLRLFGGGSKRPPRVYKRDRKAAGAGAKPLGMCGTIQFLAF